MNVSRKGFLSLSAVLVSSFLVPANARAQSPEVDNEFTWSELSDGTIEIKTSDGAWTVWTEDIEERRIAYCVDPNEVEYAITYNRITGYMDSDFTGKTVYVGIDETYSGDPTPEPQADINIRIASQTSHTTKISYKTIKNAVGTAASVASIAAAIASIIGGGTGNIISLLSSIANLISNVMSGSTSHGLVVKYNEVVREHFVLIPPPPHWTYYDTQIVLMGISTY